MLPYWMLFGACAIAALLTPSFKPDGARYYPGLWAMGVIITLMIGLRYEVGGDWINYLDLFNRAAESSLDRALSYGDPSYQLLNWFVGRQHWDIWGVNLGCGAAFTWGLIRLCQNQPNRWIALTVAIPYMVIVVAMGYTRQAAALGFIMAGLASYFRSESVLRLAAYVAVAATFHSTAVAVFPLVALTSRRNKLINFMIAASVAIVFYQQFLGSSIDRFYGVYVKSGYSSQGAVVRVLMLASAAIIFLMLRRKDLYSELEYRVWRNFSLASLAALVAVFIGPSSTAVDRLALYLLPVQIAVFCRLPNVSRESVASRMLPIALFAAVQFAWLNFAQYSDHWIPYRTFDFR